MAEVKGYQGWTNHATWCVALHLGNSRAFYDAAQSMVGDSITDAKDAPQVAEGTWSEQEAARFALEDRLKTMVEEIILPEDDERSHSDSDLFRRDMMRGYFEDVNWSEIAGKYLSDTDEYKALSDKAQKTA